MKERVCMGGRPVNVYYKNSTYSECVDNASAAYLQVVPANLGGCHISTDPARTSAKSTREYDCVGVSDGGLPVQRWFSDYNCRTEDRTAPANAGAHLFERALSPPCACMQEDVDLDELSECWTCAGAECGNEGMCTKGQGACSWQDEACSCATGIYRSDHVCWHGRLAEAIYFAGALLSACLDGQIQNYSAVRWVGDKDAGVQCQAAVEDIDGWPHAHGVVRKSCTGVPDGFYPMTRYYRDGHCKTELPQHATPKEGKNRRCRCTHERICPERGMYERYICDSRGRVNRQQFSDEDCKVATGVSTTVESFADFPAGACGRWPSMSFAEHVQWNCNGVNLAPEYKEFLGPTCSADALSFAGLLSRCVCEGSFLRAEHLASALASPALAEPAPAAPALAESSPTLPTARRVMGALTLDVAHAEPFAASDSIQAAVAESIAELARCPVSWVSAMLTPLGDELFSASACSAPACERVRVRFTIDVPMGGNDAADRAASIQQAMTFTQINAAAAIFSRKVLEKAGVAVLVEDHASATTTTPPLDATATPVLHRTVARVAVSGVLQVQPPALLYFLISLAASVS